MCSLLVDQFNSVLRPHPKPEMIVHDPVSFFSCQPIIHSDDYLTDIDEAIIIDAINELSSISAAGPDAIPHLRLINCTAELAPVLKLLFTQFLMHGFIPASFKRAAIIPVSKSGIKTSPSNYRPISLTSTIIKVFEQIVRKQVVAFLTRRGHLNNTQHGCRSGCSCRSALLGVFDDLMHIPSSDCTVDMIYLDFSKAFDKVDHGIRLHQLKDLGITGKLGIWVVQFLTNRTQYVRLPGGLSKNSPVLSGVPQGTVLGPLHFLIMLADINKEIIGFVDDTRIYSNITQTDDRDNLQSDLKTIYNWVLYNNMFVNSQKFHYVTRSYGLALLT